MDIDKEMKEDSMKENNTLVDRPFRYGGFKHDYTKDFYELTRTSGECWCCGCEMKSVVPKIKIMPYVATFQISTGKNKGRFAFRLLCRSCAYAYGQGVVECDGNTYMKPDEFSEKKWKEVKA